MNSKKLTTEKIGVVITIVVLTLIFSTRPEYLTIRNFFVFMVVAAVSTHWVVSFFRKEKIYLYVMTLEAGRDNGFRCLALTLGIIMLVVLTYSTISGVY